MFLQPLRGDKGRKYAANAAENGGKVPAWLEATRRHIVRLSLSHRYRAVRVSRGSPRNVTEISATSVPADR